MNTKQKENYLRYNTNLKLESERIRQHSEVGGEKCKNKIFFLKL